MIDREGPDYNDTSKNPRWRWRPTYREEGKPSREDWCLFDGAGKPTARIMREPDGHWRWTLGMGADGPANGGDGHCATAAEALEICERLIPGAVEAMEACLWRRI